MPNRNIPETRGGTIKLPIIGNTVTWFQRAQKGMIVLPPGGMLCAIRISANDRDMDFARASIKFELTDVSEIALYGELYKPSIIEAPLNMYDLLMLLSEPIPNLNAAMPYKLTWESDSIVGIRSVTTYHEIP